jgi:Transposase IS4
METNFIGNSDNDGVVNSVPETGVRSGSTSPDMMDIPFGMAPAMSPVTVEAMNDAIAAAAMAVTRMNPSPTSTITANSQKKRSSPGTTTARQNKTNAKKAKGSSRITPGGRVKVTKKNLFQIVNDENQRNVLKTYNENYNLYGTVISGSGSKGWKIEFDLFPQQNKMCIVNRKRITLVAKGEEETPYDKAADIEKYSTVAKPKARDKTPMQQSDIDFKKLSTEEKATASIFNMKYKKEDDATIYWKILQDTEYLRAADDPCRYPEGIEFLKDIDFITKGMSTVFFEDFLPSIVGHAELMDEFYSDIRAPYYQTVVKEGIRFHRPEDDDPDWVIKNCFLLLLAAVGEVKLGIDNLWKKGPCPGGRRDYADFGRYVPVMYFKAWQSAMPFMWCDKKTWYEERRNLTWDVFLPMLKQYNEKRQGLFKTSMLMLDESMSGWRPKTSKHGGLPNITWEPRKPVPLGTQLRNGVECYTGCLVFQDVVQTSEEQSRKDYYFEDIDNQVPRRTSLPQREPTQAHVAEVLRQVRGANLMRGGWVGGDAWFGSVMCCVELMKEFGVYSTFIVKGHTLYFPMAALHSVLVARHGTRPAGHWVTMTTTISEVTIHAIAYAWSQKGVSYFVTTCGDTEPSTMKYESKFEDEWGNTMSRSIERPNICHFIFQYLPLIDEHNKQRQSLLQLEKRWQTQCPWFRLATTLTGMSTVDMHRVYRYYEIKEMGKTYEEVDSLRVIEFSDQIAAGLRPWPYKTARKVPLGDQQQESPLCRIVSEEGKSTRELTEKDRHKGKTVGPPVVLTCYICRRYIKNNKNIQQQTSFWCVKCHMPLCKVDRSDGIKRIMSCLDEHINAEDPDLCCHSLHMKSKACPQRLWISLDTRKSGRRKV